jgi:autotransporter-associated beta strand protein
MKFPLHRQLSRIFVAIATVSALSNHALATNGTWNQTGSAANWNVNGNWNGNVFPNAVGDTATFNTALTANQTVTLGQNLAVGTLTLGATTGFSYTLAGANTLTFNNSGAGATINENSTVAGNNDTISSAIVIADTGGLKISNSSASALTISSGVTSTGTTPNLVLQANSTGSMTFNGAVNNSGTIINSGSGSGTVTFSNSSNIGSNVTGITQNSATSALILSANNSTFTAPVVVQNGTLVLNNRGHDLDRPGQLIRDDQPGHRCFEQRQQSHSRNRRLQ